MSNAGQAEQSHNRNVETELLTKWLKCILLAML
jgi:hypothetical protein